jgi:hypothetical protein|tara:strand:- start:202 stop:4656 length:4455 start_codon:yes stop_codon:yes gene_type:complete
MASQLQFNTNENKVEVNNLPLIHKAIAKVESNDDPNARGKLGERGRMQVLPSTAERPGFGIEPARDYSDLELTRVGQQYFNAMHGKYGNLNDALIAYNWGPGKTDKWIAAGRPPGIVPDGTKNYVQKVNQIVATQTGPEKDAVNVNQVVADPIQMDDSAEEIWKKYKEAHKIPTDKKEISRIFPDAEIASFRTKSFQDSFAAFNIPNPTKEDVYAHALKFNFQPESYLEEVEKFKQSLENGDIIDASGRTTSWGDVLDPDSNTAIGRFLGRTAGEVAEGVGDFGSMLLPEGWVNILSGLTNSIERELHPDVVRFIKDTFDPYHPSTTGGDVEYVGGHIASILAGGGVAIKGLGLGAKAIKSLVKEGGSKKFTLKPLEEYLAALRQNAPGIGKVTPKIPSGIGRVWIKVPVEVTKRMRRMDAVKKYAGRSLKISTGFAAGATIIEDPEENFVNLLVDTFPETLSAFKSLSINPADSKSKQYLDSFLNHLGLGVTMDLALAPAFLAKAWIRAGKPGSEQLASAAKRQGNSSLSNVETSLKELGQEASRPLEKFIPKKILGWVSSRMGTNDDLLTSIIRREGAGPAAITLANSIQRFLKKAARTDYGRSTYKTAQVTGKINDALAGNKTALKEIETEAPNTFKVIGEMREEIDSLSKAISNNLGDGPLRIKIDSNYGSYINRSYRAFDDPTWKGMDEFGDDKGAQIISNATDFLTKKLDMTPDEAKETIRWIAEGMKKDLTADFRKLSKDGPRLIKTLADMGSNAGSKPLVKKGNIPKELRELLGEVKDPYKNFGNTFEKLSIIKAEQDFLKEVIRNLKLHEMGKGGLRSPEQGWTNFKTDILEARLGRLSTPSGEKFKISDDLLKPFEAEIQKEFNLPLERLFLDPVYAQAIKNGTEIVAPRGILGRGWVAGKALSQISKTVLSPATHARNVMGNNFIMLANGMLPFSLKGEATLFAKRLAGMNTREMADLISEAQRLGVIDSGVKAGVVKATLNDIAINPTGRLSRLVDKTGVFGKVGRSSARKIFRLYQDEDNIYKFMHFNKTKDYLRKAYPDMTNDDLLKAAAQRTRDLMPNYNLVSKSLKHLRRWPFGDFLSFPAEMTRVSKNLALYTLKDLRSGSKVLQREALKRLGSMIAVGLGTDILSTGSRMTQGIDAKAEENLNTIYERYEKDIPKFFLSPIYEDDNKHTSVKYISFGPIDPFDYVKYAARAVIHAYFTDKDIDGWDLAWRIIHKQFDPFLGPSMIMEAARDLSKDAEDFEPNRKGDVSRMLKHAAKPFTPGFVPAIDKHLQYHRSLKELNENRLGKGAIGKYGETLTEDDANLFQTLAGIKIKNFDITNQLGRTVKSRVRDLNKARKTFTSSEAFTDLSGRDDQGLVDSYVNSQELKLDVLKEFKRELEAFRYLTPDGVKMSDDQLFLALTKDERYPVKNREIINNVLNNVFLADPLTKNQIKALTRSGKIDWPLGAIEKIEEIYHILNGSQIEEE